LIETNISVCVTASVYCPLPEVETDTQFVIDEGIVGTVCQLYSAGAVGQAKIGILVGPEVGANEVEGFDVGIFDGFDVIIKEGFLSFFLCSMLLLLVENCYRNLIHLLLIMNFNLVH
jgi:hypothetical protein